MMEEYPVLTAEEMMVLLSVSGGAALYGFWEQQTATRREILKAAGGLVRRGLLTTGEDGAFVPASGAVEQLLAPLRQPEQVVYLTPLAEDQPQVCFVFGPQGAVGYESLLVQSGAVRLFPVREEEWIAELCRREILREDDAVPALHRRVVPVDAAFDTPLEELLRQWSRTTAFLEFRHVNGLQPPRKVLLRDGAGEVQAVVLTPEKSLGTNDPLTAVRLTDWQMEENER